MRTLFNSALAITILFNPVLVSASEGPKPLPKAPQRIVVRNIELPTSDLVTGQLVDSTGIGIASKSVELEQRQGKVLTKTDPNGRFQAKVYPGHCIFRVGDETYACRFWSKGTAPPNSLKTLALVSATDVVRGQFFPCPPCPPMHGLPIPAIPLSPLGLLPTTFGGLALTALGVAGIAIGVSEAQNDSAS